MIRRGGWWVLLVGFLVRPEESFILVFGEFDIGSLPSPFLSHQRLAFPFDLELEVFRILVKFLVKFFIFLGVLLIRSIWSGVVEDPFSFLVGKFPSPKNLKIWILLGPPPRNHLGFPPRQGSCCRNEFL